QSAAASSYVVQYGTNQNNLSHSVTVKSNATNLSLTLSKLPSNSRIYVAITPKKSGVSGATVSTSFQTLKSSNPVGTIISWTLFWLVALVGFILVRRRLPALRVGRSVSPMVDIAPAATTTIYPQEDSATQADRLNWWMSDEQRQIAAQQQAQPHHNPADDIPD